MFVRVRSESPTGLAGSAYRSAVLALAAYGLLAALRDDTPAVPDVAGFPADGKNRTALLSAQGMPGTWQERECLHVTGPDDREVPEVKRGDPGQPKALGDGRHGGIDDARRKVNISFHEFGHGADVGALESGDLEPVTLERPQEGHLSPRSCPRLEEVPDLAQDRRGHQQRAFRMPQERRHAWWA